MKEKTVKKLMKGVIARMFTLVSERMRVHEAIQELIDNSIDAKAKNIEVKLDSVNSTFECVDDGCGMNGEQMAEYANSYVSHMPTSEKTIGKFGAGSKDAIVKIANQYDGSDVVIVSWTSENEVSRMRLKIDARKEDEFRNPEVITTPDKNWAKIQGSEHGHRVLIKYIKEIDSCDDKWKSNLIKEISTAYPFIINKYGINITINGQKLDIVDRMYLSSLGDDINECGVYIKGGNIFVVKTYTLCNLINKTDRRVVKVVYLYVPNEIADKNKDDKKYEFCGLYPILNERYLSVPSYGKTGLPFNISYQGGTGRWRACIFVDGNEDILGLKSKKSDGIDITFNNVKLAKYRLVNTKDVTFSKAFEMDFKRLNQLSVFQNHENPNEKDRVLSVDIVKRIFKGESGDSIAKEYDESIKKASNTKKALPTKIVTTSPIVTTKEDDENVKNQVEEELLAELESSIDENEGKPAVEVFTNKATGFTEYRYTEYAPRFVDKTLVAKIFKILVEEGIKKPQMARICDKVAHLND